MWSAEMKLRFLRSSTRPEAITYITSKCVSHCWS